MARGVRCLVVLSLVLELTLAPIAAQAKTSVVVDSISTIALTNLPKNGQKTYALIFKGGPFVHDKDGTVFGISSEFCHACSVVITANTQSERRDAQVVVLSALCVAGGRQ